MARRAFLAMIVLSALVQPSLAHAQKPPGDAEARFSAGLTHLREGRTELALEEIKKAVSQDDKNPFFYQGLGQAYAKQAAALPLAQREQRQRKFNDAVEAFRKSLQLNPYFVAVRNDLGMALIYSGKREEGRKEFLAAFSDPMNPTPEMTAFNLGQTYLDEENYAEAIQWFRSAIARNKIYADPYFRLADALAATGRLEEAVAQFEAGVREAPNDPAMLTGLGEVLLRAGRFTEARVQLESAIKKDPAGAWGRRAATVLKTVPK